MTSTTHKTLRGPRGGLILVKDNEELIKKINRSVFPGLQGGPHMNNICAKAICFKEAMSDNFKKYSKQILKNTKAMEGIFKKNNVKMICGGSDNHLILIDVLETFDISGDEAQNILDEIGITLNKNVIADDTRTPLDPSGIRLGTPAITTRGLLEKDCEDVAEIIVTALKNKDDVEEMERLKNKVEIISSKFEIPINNM
jgi:glycine hydroxymethyltransferase